MNTTGHQQNIYTIHESQLGAANNGFAGGGGGGGAGTAPDNGSQRNGSLNAADILIDTSSIPVTQQQTIPPMQHQHLQPQVAGGGAGQQQQQQQQQPYNDTITSQPLAVSSRVAPENQNVVYSVHPVFGLLDHCDALLVRQRAHCSSTCCGLESTNTYTVRAKDGSPILKAIENSNCCERCCFEANREYNLALVRADETVARIRKPHRVSRFCCYSNAVRIESPEDNPIGFIRQLFTLLGHPRYAIYDCQQSANQASFYLESVSCRFCCTPLLCTCVCGNKEFRIISSESKQEVGRITRRWAGDNSAAAGANDTGASPQPQPEEPFGGAPPADAFDEDQQFGIQFLSPALEARHKVLLLSACFMMDFFYFENDRRRRKLATC